MKKREVAIFDFDGTLTAKDTLLEFIKYARGHIRFYIGFGLHTPLLILMLIHLYPNWKAKQKIFAWFFKGMEYDRFAKLGESFALEVGPMSNIKMKNILKQFVKQNAHVYVVSASIDEWVRPYCIKLGVKDVLGTKVEVKDGKLTGKFLSKNCYGQEKVNRLLEVEPDRNEYNLYAFGDSRGDKEMIEFADQGFMIR